MEEADRILRKQQADAVLYTHYRTRGLEFCHETSGIARDFLRWRVQKLDLKVSAEGIMQIRKDTAEKVKNGTFIPPEKRKKPSKHRPPAPTPARAADVKLTRLEKLALGIRS